MSSYARFRQPPNVNPLLSPLATHNLLLGYNQTPVHQYNPLVQLGMPFGGADRLNLPSPYGIRPFKLPIEIFIHLITDLARRASDSSRLLKPSGSGRFTDGPRLSSQDILRLSSNASSATGFGPSSETLSGHPNVIGEDEDLMRYENSCSAKRYFIKK